MNKHHFTMTKARELADEAVEAVWGVEPGSFTLDSRTAQYWQLVFQATAVALTTVDRIEKGIH